MEEKVPFKVVVGGEKRHQILLDGLTVAQVKELMATVEKVGANGNIRRANYEFATVEIIRPIINGRLMVQKNGQWQVEQLSVVLGEDEA